MGLWVVRVVREELVQLVKRKLLSGWAVIAGIKPCVDTVIRENGAELEPLSNGCTVVGFIRKTEALMRRLGLDTESFKRVILVMADMPLPGKCLVEALVFEEDLEKSVEPLAEFIEGVMNRLRHMAAYPKSLS
jgi:hypothetical protein